MIITNLYFLLFVLLSLITTFIFITKNKGNKISNFLIASLILMHGYYILYSLFYWNRYVSYWNSYLIRNIHFNSTYVIPLSLLGNLFYLYISSVLGKKITLKKILLHSSPFLLMFVSCIHYFIQSGDTKRMIILKNLNNDYLLLPVLLDYILVFLMCVQGVLTYRLYTKTEHIDNNIRIWVKTISLSFIGLCLSFFIYYLLFYIQLLSSNQDYFISFMMSFFIGLIAYFSYYQPDIFNGKPIEKIIPFIRKYKKTGLSKKVSYLLKIKLMHAINEEKIYLRNDLALADIATILNVSRNHASQVINEHFHMSFYDFINQHRILEAKQMISTESNLSFIDIAYTVGFNNRISFYKAFKKFTGLNPSQYLESLKVS